MVGLDGLDGALQNADIVVLTLPLTETTRGMINAERLSKMKDNSVLVNIARGAIVDENALCDALKNNKLLGVALDVFEEEPLAINSPRWDMENVILTPHNSFVGEHNGERLEKIISKNLS
jgi:phosphoglycerate dehydrogenase-like enzyme